MNLKFLLNMFFVLATASSLSALQAMEETSDDQGNSVPARQSDLQTDRDVLPSRASAPNPEKKLSGRQLKDDLIGIGLPLSQTFLDELEGVKGSDLKNFVIGNRTLSSDGALLYLFLRGAGVLETEENLKEVFTYLKSIPSSDQASSYVGAYTIYFAQELMFKGKTGCNPRCFTPEAFQDSKELAPFFRYRSLVMQVWGALTAISVDFKTKNIRTAEYFIDNGYYDEALMLASALSRNPYDFFPQKYIELLKAQYENLLLQINLPTLSQYIGAVSEEVDQWVEPCPRTSILLPSTVIPKSILKRGRSGSGTSKKVQFSDDDALPKQERGLDLNSRPGNDLWSYFVESFKRNVFFQTALETTRQHSRSWLIAKEKYPEEGRDLTAELDTAELKKATWNSWVNQRANKDEGVLASPNTLPQLSPEARKKLHEVVDRLSAARRAQGKM